ncbi:sigma-70 family RNA polymerase sigma factor [Singulisphaera sp. Ch08]|uniref:Sigma-70 family RNA polymerase sigma factor n=1 Tax=Singulisphaera sp. Ch08 TaxID=3120278 RepID=A0AAU7CJT5_9BACT
MPDWQEILGRDGPAVWRTAYRLLGNSADADECFQEAFLDALKLSRRVEVRCWRGLLQRMVAARAVDRLRRNRRQGDSQRMADWNAVRDSGPSPLQAAENAELTESLRAALAQVAPKQAEVFCLYGLEGWSYQEIARHLTMSTDAVGVLLHRARKRLRQLLLTSAPTDALGREGNDPATGRGPSNAPKKESS